MVDTCPQWQKRISYRSNVFGGGRMASAVGISSVA
ncbi:MAG: hypothetical protein RLZZ135_2595, partial [Cyanobacteriota bacterium]